MHVAVCWHTPNGVHQQLQNAINSWSWVRPFGNFYIVGINAESDREEIVDALTQVARIHPDIRFLVSPAMRGQYQGWLPRDLWNAINQRTD